MLTPVHRTEVAKDWHARGFSCGLWIDHAGREWSYHAHETDELFMMMSGELELELDGKTIQPAVGEEICISAGMAHTIRNIGGKTARWLYGQPRETVPVPHMPATSQTRSFHPEVKRKRIPGKVVPPLEVSNGTKTHQIS
jgi:uncharacterized cupin superfamily protein